MFSYSPTAPAIRDLDECTAEGIYFVRDKNGKQTQPLVALYYFRGKWHILRAETSCADMTLLPDSSKLEGPYQ